MAHHTTYGLRTPNTMRAETLRVRADTLRRMRRTIDDLVEGARMEGWPLPSINFAERARKDLGNAEAVIRAQAEDLIEPISETHAINLRGEHL
jgi:hypothetical protein